MFETGQRFSIFLALQYYRHLRYLLSFTLSNQTRRRDPSSPLLPGVATQTYTHNHRIGWTGNGPPPHLIPIYSSSTFNFSSLVDQPAGTG